MANASDICVCGHTLRKHWPDNLLGAIQSGACRGAGCHCTTFTSFIVAQTVAGTPSVPSAPSDHNPLDDKVDHPQHYGGDTVYEAIKVIEAWELGFNLGNCVKYISRAGRKEDRLLDLRKAAWYLSREISNLETATKEPSK